MDNLKIGFRKSRKTFRMLQLRTVFPYGLHDHIVDKPKEKKYLIIIVIKPAML